MECRAGHIGDPPCVEDVTCYNLPHGPTTRTSEGDVRQRLECISSETSPYLGILAQRTRLVASKSSTACRSGKEVWRSKLSRIGSPVPRDRDPEASTKPRSCSIPLSSVEPSAVEEWERCPLVWDV